MKPEDFENPTDIICCDRTMERGEQHETMVTFGCTKCKVCRKFKGGKMWGKWRLVATFNNGTHEWDYLKPEFAPGYVAPKPPEKFGQKCYEAFCGHRLATGQSMPRWGLLKKEIQEAWHTAAASLLVQATEVPPPKNVEGPGGYRIANASVKDGKIVVESQCDCGRIEHGRHHMSCPAMRPNFNITINGKKVQVDLPNLSYEEVVKLAGMEGTPSMTYFVRMTRSISGSLTPGGSVNLHDDMSFNVCHTGSA